MALDLEKIEADVEAARASIGDAPEDKAFGTVALGLVLVFVDIARSLRRIANANDPQHLMDREKS